MQASRLGRSETAQLGSVHGRYARRKGMVAWLLREPVWVAVWLTAGMVARLWSFGRFPLREDEAIYAYWARLVSSGLDPMLERVAVDKPPFFIYSLAHVFTWFGATLAAGRWLNEVCSLAALILLWLLARRVYGPVTARAALAIYALSPFAISFATTLYTDPMLTAWMLLALVVAAFGWGLPAGLAAGMAFATKQNAVLFLPLVAACLLLAQRRCPQGKGRLRSAIGGRWQLLVKLLAFAAGFYYIWYKVWQWDGWRILPAEIPSFWQQAWNTYGGVQLVRVADLAGRAAAWAEVWRWLGGWTAGTVALVGLVVYGAWIDIKKLTEGQDAGEAVQEAGGAAFTAVVSLYAVGYALLHMAFTFQAWDRYLLPLAPLLALVSARGLLALASTTSGWRWGRTALVAGLLSVLLVGAAKAGRAQIPVGGDRGAYAGIEIVANYLHEHVPEQRGVLYHRWLGWHWNWYLWDGPTGRVYWSEPAMIIADLRQDPYGYDRYVVFPGWHEAERPELEAALAQFDIVLMPQLVVRRSDGGVQFTVYRFVRNSGV